MTERAPSSQHPDDLTADEPAVDESTADESTAAVEPNADASSADGPAGEQSADDATSEMSAGDQPTVPVPSNDPPPAVLDETPTGEVITGPIRAVQDPKTHAYSQTGKPPTMQMDALDSSAFEPIPSGPPTPPPSGPVMSSPMKSSGGRKRGRGRTIGLVVAAVVLLVVIAGVGSELYIRNKVTSCLQTSFDNLTGTQTDVSVSRRPMLLSMMDGDVPWVQVDTSSGDSNNIRLHARAEGISTDGGTVQKLEGNGFLPYERIKSLTQGGEGNGQQTGSTIEEITADPSAGTLKISTTFTVAIIPVPATVTLKPIVKDGAVTFEVKEATALVFGLPNDFAQPVVDQVTTAMFGPLFKQIKVSKLDVAKDGVDFAFAGTDVNLKSAAEQIGDTSGGNGCSV